MERGITEVSYFTRNLGKLRACTNGGHQAFLLRKGVVTRLMKYLKYWSSPLEFIGGSTVVPFEWNVVFFFAVHLNQNQCIDLETKSFS